MLAATDMALLPEEMLELQAIQAESIGWIPLGQGAYLHHGASDDATANSVIEVVGSPNAHMVALNVLWLS